MSTDCMAQVHSVKGFALVDFDGGEFNSVVSLLVPPFVYIYTYIYIYNTYIYIYIYLFVYIYICKYTL